MIVLYFISYFFAWKNLTIELSDILFLGASVIFMEKRVFLSTGFFLLFRCQQPIKWNLLRAAVKHANLKKYRNRNTNPHPLKLEHPHAHPNTRTPKPTSTIKNTKPVTLAPTSAHKLIYAHTRTYNQAKFLSTREGLVVEELSSEESCKNELK